MHKLFTLSSLILLVLISLSSYSLAQAETLNYDNTLIIEFPAGMDAKANQLGAVFVEQRLQLITMFQKDIATPTKLRLCKNTVEFGRVIKSDHVENIAAVAFPAERTIVVNLEKSEGFFSFEITNVLSHEIIHLIFWEYGKEAIYNNPSLPSSNYPKWFNEGIASYYAGADINMDASTLLIAHSKKELLTLEEMTLSFPKSTKKFTLAYAQSKSFVDYINQQDDDYILRILDEYAQTGQFETAFKSVTGSGSQFMFQKWQAQLRAPSFFHYLYWFQPTQLFMLCTILCLIAVWRVKRRNKRIKQRWEEEENYYPDNPWL